VSCPGKVLGEGPLNRALANRDQHGQGILGSQFFLPEKNSIHVRGVTSSLMSTFARHWWLTPVILTIQEAEIRKIEVRRQPGQNSLRDPTSKKTHHKKGLVE
jgi:hypothetical protein